MHVPDTALSPDFNRAYAQVRLDVSAGGHGLRTWAEHAHAAYVGQWSLSVQSATVPEQRGGGKFFRECLALADDDRDIDLYHWSSSKFSAAWLDTLSVLVARGRAQVGVAAATTFASFAPFSFARRTGGLCARTSACELL